MWLCTSTCSAANVLDAIWMGQLKIAPPAGITFLPALAGDPYGVAPMPTYLRMAFGGVPPAFTSYDWAQGAPTRP